MTANAEMMRQIAIRTCLPTCCASCGRIAYRPRPRRTFTASRTSRPGRGVPRLWPALLKRLRPSAEAALAAAAALAAPVPSKESAEMKIFYVYGGKLLEEDGPEWGQKSTDKDPKGQVLCITQMLPIPVNDDEQWLLRAHTYGPSGVKSAVIGQYYIKNIGGLKEFTQHDTMLVLDGGESNELVLDANGTKWSIVA